MYLEFRGATADGLCRESPRKMLLAPCGKGLVLDDRSPPELELADLLDGQR